MVTEVVCFPLRATKSAETEKALRDTLDIVTRQEGFQKACWGWESENPKTCRLLVDWDTVESHQQFQKKDCYKPFLDRLDQLVIVSEIKAFHAHLSTQSSNTAVSRSESPVIEVFLAYFPPNYSTAEQQEFEENMNKFVAILEAQASTDNGYAGGWAMEEMPIPITSTKARVYVACFGWQSVTAHLELCETLLFKANAHLVNQARGLMHTQVVHFEAARVGHGGHF